MPPPALGRADLHVHPLGNGSSLRSPAAFLAALKAAGLDVVALTDHRRIDIAVELAARGADMDLVIVVGEEIRTREGDVLGLGLCSRIPSGRSLGDAVAEVHAQGGLAVVAHPLLPLSISASRPILEALAQGPAERRPDAVEAFNARVAWLPRYRRRVERLAADAGYAVVGGSDAHRPGDIGRGVTRFPGTTLTDLAAAIESRGTTVEGRQYGLRDVAPRGRRRVVDRGRD